MSLDLSLVVAWFLITTPNYMEVVPEEFEVIQYTDNIHLLSFHYQLIDQKDIESWIRSGVYEYKDARSVNWINQYYHWLLEMPRVEEGKFIENLGLKKATFLRDAYEKRFWMIRDIMDAGGGFFQHKYRMEAEYCDRMRYMYDHIVRYLHSNNIRSQRESLQTVKEIIGEINFRRGIYLEWY